MIPAVVSDLGVYIKPLDQCGFKYTSSTHGEKS